MLLGGRSTTEFAAKSRRVGTHSALRSLVHLIAHGSLGNPENELMVAAGCTGPRPQISRRCPENEMLSSAVPWFQRIISLFSRCDQRLRCRPGDGGHEVGGQPPRSDGPMH